MHELFIYNARQQNIFNLNSSQRGKKVKSVKSITYTHRRRGMDSKSSNTKKILRPCFHSEAILPNETFFFFFFKFFLI